MMQGQGSDADSNDAAMASYCDSYKAPLCLRGFYHVCTKTVYHSKIQKIKFLENTYCYKTICKIQ